MATVIGKMQKITTDTNGSFLLPTEKGLFIIDVDYKDGTKGGYSGRSFDGNRYKYA